MDMFTAITQRRSIRKYEDAPMPREDIEKIIAAGIQAPSAKNRQPWRFVIVEGGAKAGMMRAMRKGLREAAEHPKSPEEEKYIVGAQHTALVMEQAPVTVFIINPLNKMGDTIEDSDIIPNVQSAGACIQNMLLAATDLGYGSLWNCDIYSAYSAIAQWLNSDEQVIAAVSFGAPAEAPNARPRNRPADLIQWRVSEENVVE